VWTHTGAGRVATGIANSSPSQPAGEGNLPTSSGANESLRGPSGDLAENPGSPVRLRAGVMNPLLALVHTGVDNDFEDVAFRQHPPLRDIKRALAGSPEGGTSQALLAALSGSGSALFGIYGSTEAALEAQRRVQSTGTAALLTETLPRSAYWRQMFA
jgi:4-diphosphocytidyl-2-C-methyl-D-erythritol kinase